MIEWDIRGVYMSQLEQQVIKIVLLIIYAQYNNLLNFTPKYKYGFQIPRNYKHAQEK